LHERTNIRGLAIFLRGNADDAALPHAVNSDGALEFFPQVMGIPVLDVLRQYERWSVTQDEGMYSPCLCNANVTDHFLGAREKNDVNSVRKQVSAHLVDTLHA
jgi:hypothetical protein